MNTTEIIAVIFSLLCVILTIQRNIWSWPIGIIGIVAYSFVFLSDKLYADFILQFFYFVQSLIGWNAWSKNKFSNNKIKTERISNDELVLHIGIFIMLWASITMIMVFYTQASIPFVDVFLSIASLLANWYLIKRVLESWIIWIVVDAIYVFMFMYKGLYLSSILYVLFLVLAIKGFLEWKRALNIKTE